MASESRKAESTRGLQGGGAAFCLIGNSLTCLGTPPDPNGGMAAQREGICVSAFSRGFGFLREAFLLFTAPTEHLPQRSSREMKMPAD